MLVISRRVGESVQIGDDIELSVLKVNGRTVRLGINAPRDVEIHRSELYVRIKRAESLPATAVDVIPTT